MLRGLYICMHIICKVPDVISLARHKSKSRKSHLALDGHLIATEMHRNSIFMIFDRFKRRYLTLLDSDNLPYFVVEGWPLYTGA